MPQIQIGITQLAALSERALSKGQAALTALEAMSHGSEAAEAMAQLKQAIRVVERLQHVVQMSRIPAGSLLEAVILTNNEVEALRTTLYDDHCG